MSYIVLSSSLQTMYSINCGATFLSYQQCCTVGLDGLINSWDWDINNCLNFHQVGSASQA
jgi:hypothetical protein